jgi:hemerythrin-like domain-containing protein
MQPPDTGAEPCVEPMALLMAEHRVIESVLDALAAYGAAAARGAELDRGRLGDFIAFIRGYADAIHHGKEESILFAAVRQRGAPGRLATLIAAMCRDHETARLLTGDLGGLARRATWSARDRADLARVANEYVSLLRRHIADEDMTAFPGLAAFLGPAGLRSVSAAFERFEREHAERRDGLRALAARLAGPG